MFSLKDYPNFGAFVISLIVTLGFIGALVYAMVHGVQDNPTLQGLVGALTTAFSMVIGYWIGSSAGSKAKDAVIASSVGAQKPPAAPPTPVLAFAALAISALVIGLPGPSYAACTPPDLTQETGVATALVKLGYLPSGQSTGAAYSAAVQKFQAAQGLGQDGIAGALTQAALATAFCASSGNPLTALQQFTVADLQAALADAQAHNDSRHGQCWQAAIPLAQQWQLPIHVPTGAGLAQLAQSWFDTQNALRQPLIPDSLVEACALTTYDLRVTMAQFAGALGATISPIKLPFNLSLPLTVQ